METVITYYNGDIKDSVARGEVSLDNFVQAHISPKQQISNLLDAIQNESDKKKRGALKSKLFYFTPSVVIPIGKRRRYENIERFTGLMQVDIDNLESVEVARELREYLFRTYEQFYCVYLSPSKKGVKGLLKIPICESVKEYKEYFQGVEDELDWIYGFDSAPKNAVLPLYISRDSNLFYRERPSTWATKGEVANIETYENLTPTPIPTREGGTFTYKSQAYYERITIDIFVSKINQIFSSDGHPRLRSACLVLGSRTGAGYLSYTEALTLAENSIRANGYLRKGVENYIKTSKWAITEGFKKPKYYG